MSSLLLLMALCAPDDGPITMEAYREELRNILTSVEAGDVFGAQETARELMKRKVVHRSIEFTPDPSIVGELERAPDESRMTDLAPRLEALLRALEDAPSEVSSSKPDPKRLENLRRQQALENPVRGGDLTIPEGEVPQSWTEWIGSVLERVGDLIERFFKWLGRTFFGNSRVNTPSTGTNFAMPGLVTILVVILLTIIGALAIIALRKGEAPSMEFAASTGTSRDKRDEDPLTRTAGEWERRAIELAAAGRYREAIRAWYHAVLVTAFRAGILHYRRDRTNWEYASSLGPQVDWRPAFLEATRDFEREWYGRRNTAEETAEIFSRSARGILDRLHVESMRR